MSDDFLHRALVRQPKTREYKLGAEVEPPDDDLGCFGWLRGTGERAQMLELRKRSGNILAVGYGWLERALFDPSEGIELHLAGHVIRIRGQRLNSEVRPGARLFEGITWQRVRWIRESERDAALGDVPGTVVESIEW